MPELVYFHTQDSVEAHTTALYLSLLTKLKSLLPFAQFSHVGSTSVPGALTKGDLDIAACVDANRFAASVTLMDSQYARHTNSFSDHEYQPYILTSANQDVGIQLFIAGSEYETKFIAWRNRLIDDPALLVQYNLLKEKYHGKSMTHYRSAKATFIEANLDHLPSTTSSARDR